MAINACDASCGLDRNKMSARASGLSYSNQLRLNMTIPSISYRIQITKQSTKKDTHIQNTYEQDLGNNTQHIYRET